MAILSKPTLKKETGMEHVKNLLTYATDFGIYNSLVNDSTLLYFSSLGDFLRDQEEIFYDALGISGVQELNYFLAHINIINHYNYLNAEGKIYNQLKRDYFLTSSSSNKDQLTYEEDVMELLMEMVNNSELGQSLIKELDQNDDMYTEFFRVATTVLNNIRIPGNPISMIITANRMDKSKNYGSAYYRKNNIIGEASIRVSLGSTLTPGEIQLKEGQFEITGDPTISGYLRKSKDIQNLRSSLREYLNKTPAIKQSARSIYEESPDKWREIVNEYILKSFPGADLTFAKSIALNHSTSSISGYLGEIQSHLYFDALFKDLKITDAAVRDSGAEYIKSLSGATQMDPADTVIEVLNHIFNVQVKNYAKNGASWSGSSSKVVQVLGKEKKIHGTSSAESFVKERLQINDPALLNFFGAATWHNLNPEYSRDKKYAEYRGLYSEFQNIFAGLKEAFDTFLPNIIRLTAVINGLDDLQYENFYFQKGYVIPASAIVDGIIDGIMNPKNTIFTSSYGMYPGGSHFTYQHPFEDSYNAFASETSISWRVSISFSAILHRLGL